MSEIEVRLNIPAEWYQQLREEAEAVNCPVEVYIRTLFYRS